MDDQQQQITSYQRVLLLNKLADLRLQIEAATRMLANRDRALSKKQLQGILIALSQALDVALN